jgi:hypothetical protein
MKVTEMRHSQPRDLDKIFFLVLDLYTDTHYIYADTIRDPRYNTSTK